MSMGYAPPNKRWLKKFDKPGESASVRGSLPDKWRAAICDPAWLALAGTLAAAIWLWTGSE